MKTSYVFFAAIALMAISVSRVGAQAATAPQPFNEVVIDGSFTVYLAQGPENNIMVDGSEANKAAVVTAVKDGTLSVDTDGKKGITGVTLYITVKDLKKMTVKGGAVVGLKSPVRADKLDLKLLASTINDMQIEAKRLDVELDDAAKIMLTVQADNMKLHLDGSSAATVTAENIATLDVDMEKAATLDLSGKVVECNIDMDEVATTTLLLEADELEADVDGASTITIKGTASSVKYNISGGSFVHALDFVVSSASAALSEASFAEIGAQKSLHVNLKESSKVSYTEHGQKKTIDASGSFSFKF